MMKLQTKDNLPAADKYNNHYIKMKKVLLQSWFMFSSAYSSLFWSSYLPFLLFITTVRRRKCMYQLARRIWGLAEKTRCYRSQPMLSKNHQARYACKIICPMRSANKANKANRANILMNLKKEKQVCKNLSSRFKELTKRNDKTSLDGLHKKISSFSFNKITLSIH